MSEPRHTPGPWSHAYCQDDEGWDVARADDITPIATVWLTDAECTSAAEANADLIAAAPALALAWRLVPDEIRQKIFDALYSPSTEWVEPAIAAIINES